MMKSKAILIGLVLFALAPALHAKEIRTIETDDADVEVRIFPADGNVLLLGFPCDEGKSIAEEKTAISLANDGIEVWMPDMLSGFMLPKVRSSLVQISTDTLTVLLNF